MLRRQGTSWQETVHPSFGVARDVYATAADDIMVVAKDSQISRWNGSTWQTDTLNDKRSCYSLLVRAPTDVFAACGRSMFHYDGSSWIGLEWDFTTPRALIGLGDSRVFALGARGVTAEFTGRGFVENGFPTGGTVTALAAISPRAVFAGRTNGPAFFDGRNWQPTAGERIRDIWASGPTDAIALGSNTTYRFNGSDWSVEALPAAMTPLFAVDGSDANNAWIIATTGMPAQWDGTSWTPRMSPTPVSRLAVFSPSDAWFGGTNVLYQCDGTSFVRDDGFDAVATSAHSIGGTSATDLWVGTANNGLWHRDTDGWSLVDELPTAGATYRFVSAIAPDDVYVGVTVGQERILHFDGDSWTRVRTRATAFFGDAAAGVLAAGGAEEIDILADLRQ